MDLIRWGPLWFCINGGRNRKKYHDPFMPDFRGVLLASVVYCIDLIPFGSIPYQTCQPILRPASGTLSPKPSPQSRIQKLSGLSPNFALPFRSIFDWPKNPLRHKS